MTRFLHFPAGKCRRWVKGLAHHRIVPEVVGPEGLDRLVLAMMEMPDARALIAGHYKDGFMAKLTSIAEERGVGGRVRFLARQITGADKEGVLFGLPVAVREPRQCRGRGNDSRAAGRSAEEV